MMAKPHSGIVRSDSQPPNFTPLTHCAPGTSGKVISSGFSFSRKALVQKKKGGWWGELRFVRYSLIPVQP